MNIFELGFAALTLGGAIAGFSKGLALYGVLGAIAGTVCGAALGLGCAFVVVFCIGAVVSIVTRTPLFPPKPPRV